MLGKLIKYDMKTLSRLLILVHIPMIIMAFVGRYAGVERMIAVQKPELSSILSLLLCIIYWSFISVFTMVYIAIYTYRSLFTYEGYLTMTLPIKASTHVWAKFLSGSMWILIDSIILYTSLIIVGSVPELVNILEKVIPDTLALYQLNGPSSLGVLMLVLTFVSCFGSMAVVLGSLSLGHCFRKHRILISVLGYCGFLTANQLLGGAIGAAASIRNYRYMEATGQELPRSLMSAMYASLFNTYIVLMIILGVICFAFSCHVLKKKINLD